MDSFTDFMGLQRLAEGGWRFCQAEWYHQVPEIGSKRLVPQAALHVHNAAPHAIPSNLTTCKEPTYYKFKAMYGLSAAFMPLRPTDAQHLDLSKASKMQQCAVLMRVGD